LVETIERLLKTSREIIVALDRITSDQRSVSNMSFGSNLHCHGDEDRPERNN